MNDELLSEIWNSPANRPRTDDGEQIARVMIARIRNRRQRTAIWLGWTFFSLASITALVAIKAVRDAGELFTHEWGMVLLLALPWIVSIRAWVAFRRDDTRVTGALLPVADALDRARRSNAGARRHLFAVGLLFALFVPLLCITIPQLEQAGKATPDEARSLALVLGSAMAIGAGTIAARYFLYLRPEQRRIDELTRGLGDSASR